MNSEETTVKRLKLNKVNIGETYFRIPVKKYRNDFVCKCSVYNAHDGLK